MGRGTSKVPIEGLVRSQGPIRGTSSMLALLALPLLAMSARGQVEDRSLLEDLIEDLEQHQYPDYQHYNDQVYDGEPAPVRALHQEDSRTATRQGKQIKSSMLPAYCDPPNPCPLGYTAQDGCIEDFENNSEFSQKYQASQNCMCDTEHMFACPQPTQQDGGLSFLGGFPSVEEVKNPYLAGAKLSIAAKKGMATRSARSISWATRPSPEERWPGPSKQPLSSPQSYITTRTQMRGGPKYFNSLF